MQDTPHTQRVWLRMLGPLTRLCASDALSHHAPAWLNRVSEHYLAWYLEQTLGARMEAAEQAGVGRSSIWMPPGSESATVLAWFEQHVQHGPRASVEVFDHVVCALVPCSYDPHLLAPHEAAAAVPNEQVYMWNGTRGAWWMDGAGMVEQHIPLNHPGLYLQVTHMRDLFVAASAPQTTPQGSAPRR